MDEDLIHTWQKGTVSGRYNRFSNKCRGNFFPPESKKAPRSGRVRSPRRACHRAEVGLGLDQSTRAPTHHLVLRRKPQSPDHATPRVKECADPVWRCKED